MSGQTETEIFRNDNAGTNVRFPMGLISVCCSIGREILTEWMLYCLYLERQTD